MPFNSKKYKYCLEYVQRPPTENIKYTFQNTRRKYLFSLFPHGLLLFLETEISFLSNLRDSFRDENDKINRMRDS